jgi:hypothetical protein
MEEKEASAKNLDVISGRLKFARQETERESRVEVGLNTSTIALRVVGGHEKEVSNLRQ